MKVFAVLFLLTISNLALAQETDSVEADIPELDKRGGFQDIKLNTDISEYSDLEYKKDIKDELFPGAKLYVRKKGAYSSIGRVPIENLEVYTYKDLIYKIIIVSEKDPAIYQGLSNNFGKNQYNHREKAYYWKTKKIRLYFKSGKKNELILEYYSYVIHNMRTEEIKKSYTDVADDF